MPVEVLASIEDILYGVEGIAPRLPTLVEIAGIILGWVPRLIDPQSITGLCPLLPGYGDLTLIKTPGIFTALPVTRLVETSIDGLYQLIV